MDQLVRLFAEVHGTAAVTRVRRQEHHVHSILEKLKVHRRGEIAWVVRHPGAPAENANVSVIDS